MSGERRFQLAGLFALLIICVIFLIASGASAEESEEEDGSLFIHYVNNNQLPNGSWDDDINITYKVTVANLGYIATVDFFTPDDSEHDEVIVDGINYTINTCIRDAPIETKGFIAIEEFSAWNTTWVEFDDDAFRSYRSAARSELVIEQKSNGSWNDDIGDTAIATYGLATTRAENPEPVDSGVEWIQEKKDEKEQSWGSIENDSKAIIALDSTGIDVREEIKALMQKQKSDGSYGNIEETSWAVIALSTHPNEETIELMEKAMQWLRSQDYDTNEDLAMAALAEQYFLNAVKSFNENSSGGNGPVHKNDSRGNLIFTPWSYAIFILVITAIALCYWLFARLDKNHILEGVRKDIYTYISEHPGEHLASITKNFNLSSSSARYHLSVLEGMDCIVSHKNGKYKRYYINKNGYSKYTNGNGYKHIMSALKNNTARKMVKFLLKNPDSNQKSISSALKIHPSTVNWHAKRLRDAEIINKQKKGKEISYSLNQDVQLKKVIGILEGSFA